MPQPLKARPGIGVLRDAGAEFEQLRNKQLIQAFGPAVVYKTDKSGEAATENMKSLLTSGAALPRVLLQGKIEPNLFRSEILTALGVDDAKRDYIPSLSGLIPDVVLVRKPAAGDEEVLCNGSRSRIAVGTEARAALSMIDIKHASEANPSYSSEMALYAVMMANWLRYEGLENSFYVSADPKLWTRFHQGASLLEQYINDGKAHGPEELIGALLADCEDANFRFYMPAVLRFFRDDIPRVVSIGDSNWRELEWHVDSRCSSCDWLGLGKWASSADKAKIAAAPDHYCLPAAEKIQHLSRVPGITRGARKTLEVNSIVSTSGLATTSGTEPAYKQHTFLKREKSRLPARAKALHSGSTSTDGKAILAGLAAWPHLQACATINFDASSGLLTGLALLGRVSSYISGQPIKKLPPRSFLVDQKALANEWIALEAFLTQLADYIDGAGKFLQQVGQARPLTGQIAFWERRQFEELCAAMGRHLPKVLALTNRKAKALAWMFPSEEMIEKEEGAISPCIVFIDDIVRRVVFAPVPHVITLFETVENYHFGNYAPVVGDSYYREYLSNGVPRERVYEIWGGTQIVQRGPVSLPRTTVISEFSNALLTQCRALDSVVMRLRDDFKNHLKSSAPAINLTVPQGARNVAFDSKLWIWWDELEHATSRMEAHERLAQDVDTLEANYQAVRLTNQIQLLPNGHRIYEVGSESSETKLDDGESYLALGLGHEPGFPLELARRRIVQGAPPYQGAPWTLSKPLYSTIRASLIRYDRVQGTAEVAIQDDDGGQLLSYLQAHGGIDLQKDIFLTPSKPFFNWANKSRDILSIVGNPGIAAADSNAAKAMGLPGSAPGKDAVTPCAEVLWSADKLQLTGVVPDARADAIADYAKQIADLNPSQRAAVWHAAARGLTVVWGPPGTGKTKTLGGFIHAVAQEASGQKEGLKILVCGPTYKAVEELVGRALSTLDGDKSCSCDLFVAYSKNRIPAQFTSASPGIHVSSFNLIQASAEWANCANSLADSKRVTIVAATAHQAYKLCQFISGTTVTGLFDIVIMDESSQIPVTIALSPLATLKTQFRIVVAGDHLQMPPITALEAPVGAEYLVGSIQTYLRKRFAPHLYTCDLIENYRSSEVLVKFARELGYPQSLVAHYPDTRIKLMLPISTPSSIYPQDLPYSAAWKEVLDQDKPAITILHDDDLSSQSNLFEAQIVAGITMCLRSSMSPNLEGRGTTLHAPPNPEHFWSKSVGIVTPHRAQRALVVRELRKRFPKAEATLIDDAVDTVEKFQGGERHVIIVSFGVGDADVIAGEESFLMQLERTNVAISRAMAKCIVIMPTSLAGHVPIDKKALATAHAIKGYVDEFCANSKAIQIEVGGTVRAGTVRWA